MRILLISFSEHFTFQETIYNLHNELDGMSNVELWTMGNKNMKYKACLTEKNILADCPDRPGITKDTFSLKKINTVINTIKKINPDIIMFDSVHLWNIFINLRLRKKCKMYHVIHDVIPHKGDKQEKFVYIYNWIVARLADMIILHNKKFVKEFCGEYRCPNEKVKFTELWKKYDDYLPLEHTGRCLFFGRINFYKGIDYLVDIVKKCPNIKFDIVGKVDKEMEQVVKKIEGFSNVNLDTNYVDDVAMRFYFKNADWILLPYRSATQSGVVVDAYCFSRPVIAFNVGALDEQVKEGISGYLINDSNIDEFVNRLEACIKLSDDEKDKIAYASWQYGYEKYSIQKGGSRFFELFDM